MTGLPVTTQDEKTLRHRLYFHSFPASFKGGDSTKNFPKRHRAESLVLWGFYANHFAALGFRHSSRYHRMSFTETLHAATAHAAQTLTASTMPTMEAAT